MNDRTTPDGRVFYWLANIPHERVDKTHTEVAIWHSACAICGAAFSIATPTNGVSKAFGRKHCDEHKQSNARFLANTQK